MYRNYLKRFFDLLVTLPACVLVSPLFVVVCVALYIANRGKIFFLQERPGMNTKPFTIIKFKTMNDRKDADGKLLPDNVRLTPVGAFLRKMSLDEIPQLINVVMGDMSLVGPRPLLFKYIPLYNKEQVRRHEVRPGITGWAQVNGRNSISWTDKFRFDVHYVDNLSFLFDLKIIWRTAEKVVKREGINQSAERPMPPFDGTN